MLVEMLIAQACTNLPALRYDACAKALEATSMQCHVKQDVDQAEQVATAIVRDKTTSITGEKPLGAVLLVAKVYRDKSISYPIIRRSNGLMPSLSSTATLQSCRIELRWNF